MRTCNRWSVPFKEARKVGSHAFRVSGRFPGIMDFIILRSEDQPVYRKEQFHPGVDIAGAEKTPIMTPAKGTVTFVGKDGPLGMTVRIKHDSVYETTYGHLHSASVKKGQHVDRGEMIGYMGNSGRSTGHHLHYEVAKSGKNVNPTLL